MIGHDGYPHGVPCWIDLEPPEPAAVTAFYGAVLGWAFEERVAGDAPYLVATLRGEPVAGIGAPTTADRRTVWNTYVTVDDLDTALARTAPSGGEVRRGAATIGDLARVAEVVDPTGAAIRLWEPGTLPGAVLVNQDGTWNTSDLVTSDADAATGFYADLLGWVADVVGFDGWSATMLRVPGYGDVLARYDPDIRERHAADGVPPGFSDAIGWLESTEGDDDQGSHWRVTFTVDDPDEVARRAEAAGGEVVVPPFDAPPVRTTIVRDPSGATFQASAYDP